MISKRLEKQYTIMNKDINNGIRILNLMKHILFGIKGGFTLTAVEQQMKTFNKAYPRE